MNQTDWQKWQSLYDDLHVGAVVSNGEELWIKAGQTEDEVEDHHLYNHFIGLQSGAIRHYSHVLPWRRWERSLICVQF